MPGVNRKLGAKEVFGYLAIGIGALMTIASATTAGLGFLAMWIGLGLTLGGGAVVRWGGGFIAALIMMAIGMSMGGNRFGATATPTSAAPMSAPAAAPNRSTGTITAEDMKREKKRRFGSRDVSAVEKDGQWVVLFTPALLRSDEAVLGGAEYALREFLNVNTNNAKWRPVDKFLRCITGSGIFDVLIIKNDDGTVYGMSIVKR